MTINRDDELWYKLCTAENAFYEARTALLREAHDLASLIGVALDTPSQRGTALRLLNMLQEEMIRPHFYRLVDLVSVGHSDIQLCRMVLLKIDRNWLIENIESQVMQILKLGGEEEFRRIAEFYKLLSSELLAAHLERCARHVDEEIKEVASDFA